MTGRRDRGDAIVIVLCAMAVVLVLMLALLMSSGFLARHTASETRRQQTKIYAQSFLDVLIEQMNEENEWSSFLSEFSEREYGASESFECETQDGYELQVAVHFEDWEEALEISVSVCARFQETGDSYISEVVLLVDTELSSDGTAVFKAVQRRS